RPHHDSLRPTPKTGCSHLHVLLLPFHPRGLHHRCRNALRHLRVLRHLHVLLLRVLLAPTKNQLVRAAPYHLIPRQQSQRTLASLRASCFLALGHSLHFDFINGRPRVTIQRSILRFPSELVIVHSCHHVFRCRAAAIRQNIGRTN